MDYGVCVGGSTAAVCQNLGWRCVYALLWPESMRMTSPGGWGGAQTSLLRVRQRKQTDPYIAAMGTVTFHAVWLQAHDHMRMCSDLFSNSVMWSVEWAPNLVSAMVVFGIYWCRWCHGWGMLVRDNDRHYKGGA